MQKSFKTLVQYGKWGEYCEKYTGYKQAMAEKLHKNLQGIRCRPTEAIWNFENSESIKNLGVTKLIELTAIPADEREQFVEENNITEETTVKQLHKLIQEKTDALDRAEKKQAVAEKKLEEQIKQSEQAAEDKRLMIERLQAELDIRNAEPATVPQDELEKMMKEADENAKKSLQKEIDRLTEEKEKAEQAAKKSKEKYKKLKDEVSAEKEKVDAAEKENAELKQTIEKLQKESQVGSNENMVKLQMCFEQAQTAIIAVKTALAAVEGSEKYDKLFAAVKETLKGKVEEI